MVISHVETVIERVTGIDRATPDSDGDYQVLYRGGHYYVRIVEIGDQPIVRVYSPVIKDLEASPELFEAVNYINTRLNFCRCFLVGDSVMIETEHLGTTIRSDDFRMLSEHVTAATAVFGRMLVEKFGGMAAPDETLGDSSSIEPVPGLYL